MDWQEAYLILAGVSSLLPRSPPSLTGPGTQVSTNAERFQPDGEPFARSAQAIDRERFMVARDMEARMNTYTGFSSVNPREEFVVGSVANLVIYQTVHHQRCLAGAA